MGENLSSGFVTKSYPNKPAQLQLLENYNFTCSKVIYDTFQKANNKGADQTVQMRRVVCSFVVPKP